MDNTIYERLAVPANRTEEGFYSEEDGLLSYETYHELQLVQRELKKLGIEATLKEAETYWASFSSEKYLASWIDFPEELGEEEITYAYDYFEIKGKSKVRMNLKLGNKILEKKATINSEDINKFVVTDKFYGAPEYIIESNRYDKNRYFSNISERYKIYPTKEEAIEENKGWSSERKLYQLVYKEPNLHLKYISEIEGISTIDATMIRPSGYMSKKGEIDLRLKKEAHSYIDIATLKDYNRNNYKGNNYVIILANEDFNLWSIAKVNSTEDQYLYYSAIHLFSDNYISLNEEYFTIFKYNPEKDKSLIISTLSHYYSKLSIKDKHCTRMFICKLLFEEYHVTLEIVKEYVLFTEKQLREGTRITDKKQLNTLCKQDGVFLTFKYKDTIHVSANANVDFEHKELFGDTVCGIPLPILQSKEKHSTVNISSYIDNLIEHITCENCNENLNTYFSKKQINN